MVCPFGVSAGCHGHMTWLEGPVVLESFLEPVLPAKDFTRDLGWDIW